LAEAVFSGQCSGWKNHGLHFDDTSSEFVVTGMHISDNAGYGINLEADADKFIISGCQFENNTGGGINDLTGDNHTKNLEGNLGFNPLWKAYTPTVSSNGGSITAAADGFYKKIGTTVFVSIKIHTITADSGTGWVIVTLPTGPGAVSNQISSMSAHNETTGILCYAKAVISTTQCHVIKYDGNYPSATSKEFYISGFYSVA
jgi:hypothetical protein